MTTYTYVLLRNGVPHSTFDTAAAAMDYADEQREHDGWFSQDLYPPEYKHTGAVWEVHRVPKQ